MVNDGAFRTISLSLMNALLPTDTLSPLIITTALDSVVALLVPSPLILVIVTTSIDDLPTSD